ncbi:Glyoxalase-like domain protein [compost metagenome]
MKLDHIEILTNELEATKDFYEKILELPITEYDSKSVSIKIGGSTLTFVENIEKSNPIYHVAFNIPQNKLNEVMEWCENRIELIKKEDAVLVAEFESWNANAVYFYDNNGNLLEFIARKDLPNSEAEAFSSKQILNISEIGIVKENPLDFGNQLIEEYGLHLFDKNQNSELFTAIGDDNGLLIIVRANRNWYPTEIPAKSYWTKIGLTNNEQSNLIEITA